MLNQQIIIYAHQYQAPQVVYAVQHDTGRTLTFIPGDFQLPAGATAQLWCKSPSGVLSFAAGTVSGQEITAALTEYNLAEAGNNLGQLQISADGDYIKGFSFILRVQEEVNGEELTPEETTLLEQAIAEMQAEISTQLAAFEDEMDNLVPKTTEINGHALSQNITLTPADVDAVPETREINGHALTGDIDLTPADLDAVPETRKVNNYTLDQDVTIHAVDIPVIPPQGLAGENAQALFEELAAKLGQVIQYDILKSTYPVSGSNTYAVDWQDYDLLVFGIEQFNNRLDSIVMSTAWFRTTDPVKRPYSQAHTLSNNSQINYQIYQDGEGSVTVIHSGANPGVEYGFYLDGIKISAPSGSGGGGSINWGSIGGTLSNQTDLANALGTKISAPSSPATGAFLVWDGSAWVAQTLSTWQGGNY